MENIFGLPGVLVIGILLVVILVALIALSSSTGTTGTGGAVVPAPAPAPTPIYVFDQSQDSGPAPLTQIPCDCTSPTPILVGEIGTLAGFNSDGGAWITYRAEDNSLYAGSYDDDNSQDTLFQFSLAGFDSMSPSLTAGPDILASATGGPGGSIRGIVWSSADGVFYVTASESLWTLTVGGVWTDLGLIEGIEEYDLRGLAIDDSGNIVGGDSPNYNDNNIRTIDPADVSGSASADPVQFDGEDIEGVTALTRDNSGNYWLAIRPDGYDPEDATPIVVYNPTTSALTYNCFLNTSRVVAAMTFDGNGRMWLFTGGQDDESYSLYVLDPPPCPDAISPP